MIFAGEKVEVVKKFDYLGRILSDDGDDTFSVESRISKGWQAFQKHKGLITSKRLSVASRRKTYLTYVQPVVLYAMETIVWKPTLVTKMNTFQNHIMRWISGNRQNDRIPITTLQEITGLGPLIHNIKKQKMSWFGHFKRSDSPVKHVFEGLVNGTTSRGRPQRRWRDDIHEWTQMSWTHINRAVHDRNTWRSIALSPL